MFTTGQASIKKNKVVDLFNWQGGETMNRGRNHAHLRLWPTLLCGLLLVAVVSIALQSATSQVAKAESPFRPLLEPGVTGIKPIPNAHAAPNTCILNLGGRGPGSPMVWQFRAEMLGGTGLLTDSGPSVPT